MRRSSTWRAVAALPLLLPGFAGRAGAAQTPTDTTSDPGRSRQWALDRISAAEGWSVATGDLLHTLVGHGGPVVGVAFRADGQQLVSGAMAGKVSRGEIQSSTMTLTTINVPF